MADREKVTVTAADVGALKVVEAAGTASAGKANLGKEIEAAMSKAVADAYAEAEAVWKRDDLSEDGKRAQSAALVEPEAVRKRMLDAREAVKASHRPHEAAAE